MYVVLIGRPGVGKGTQSQRLADFLGVPHVATGELLREAKASDNPLGAQVAAIIDRGDLVPDELVVELVRERLGEESRPGCLFDGIPRTIRQAELLDELLARTGNSVGLALEMEADEETVTRRMLQRAELEGRDDDTPATIQHRMQVYANQTYPLVDYYKRKGVLRSLDATGPPEEVFESLKAAALQARHST